MKYANITLMKNKHIIRLIETEYYNEYKLYPPCIFQFITLKNKPASPTHYSVNIIDNLHIINYPFREEKNKCSFTLHYSTLHFHWLPNGVFHNYSPKIVYQEIIKIDGQNV